MLEWCSRLPMWTEKLDYPHVIFLISPTVFPKPPSHHPSLAVTYLRCRSMLEADSSMAVGLAIFLPTAWANGCRAPCGQMSSPESLAADILQNLKSGRGITWEVRPGTLRRCKGWGDKSRPGSWEGQGDALEDMRSDEGHTQEGWGRRWPHLPFQTPRTLHCSSHQEPHQLPQPGQQPDCQ